jgi:hypothetical protein
MKPIKLLTFFTITLCLIMSTVAISTASTKGTNTEEIVYFIPLIASNLQETTVWIEDDGAWSLISSGNTLQEAREPVNTNNTNLVSNYFYNVSFNRPPFSGQPVYTIGRGYYQFDLSSLPEINIITLSLKLFASTDFPPEFTIYIHEGTWSTGFQKENWNEYGSLLTAHHISTAPGQDEVTIHISNFSAQARPDLIKFVIRVDEMTEYPDVTTAPAFSAIVRPNEPLEIPPEFRARLVIGFTEE